VGCGLKGELEKRGKGLRSSLSAVCCRVSWNCNGYDVYLYWVDRASLMRSRFGTVEVEGESEGAGFSTLLLRLSRCARRL
jgi:hypothetical protein